MRRFSVISEKYVWTWILLACVCSGFSLQAQQLQLADSVRKYSRVDSLTQRLSAPQRKLGEVNKEFSSTTASLSDSLRHLKSAVVNDSLKLDSLQEWYQRQQNRIKSYPQSKKEKLQQLDTLTQSFEKKKEALEKERQEHAGKIEEQTKKLESKIAAWKQKLKETLNPLDSLGVNTGKADGLELPGDMPALPDTNVELPSVQLPQVPELNVPKTELPSGNLGNLSLQTPALPKIDKPDLSVPDVSELSDKLNIPELEAAQKSLGEFKELSEKVKVYKKDIDSLDREKVQGKLEGLATDLAKNLDEIKELQKMEATQLAQAQKLKEQQDMMRQYQDKEYIEQQMEKRSLALANDVVAKNATKVKEAQEQVVKSQKKYKQFSSLKDAKKHPFNSLHGVPFLDRFYYGVSLQFQQTKYTQFFMAPIAQYRVNGRLTFGAGFTYRGQVQTKPQYEWISEERVSGARVFLKVGIKKGIAIHTEYERLNTRTNISVTGSNHAMVGLSKSFRLSKKVGGEALILYNLGHKKDDIYSKQLNVRTNILFGRSYR